MGTYGVIILADGDGNSLGQYTLDTSVGPVVIIFSDIDHLAEVAAYAERFLPVPDAQIGALSITADSPAQAVGMIEKAAPEWAAKVNFVSDEDELFDALLAALREQK